MKRFFEIDSKREFFDIVKYIRTHGERFVNETLGYGIERRGYICGRLVLFIWYGDHTYRLNLDLNDGMHYYYYPESGKIEVANSDFKAIDVIVA